MNTNTIIQQLQQLTLQCQGLIKPSLFGTGKNAVLKTIEHLGYVQIDTLSIIERAHHHTLWSRIPDYKTADLEALVSEHHVFEYWFHAASYLPMKDFRYALTQMLAVKRNTSHYYNADPKVMQYVMDKICAEGPQKARDFEQGTQKTGTWWCWKPAKLALERLFMQGDLMICGREGMQKTYDIRERVLPHHIDSTEPTPIEFAEYLVKTYLRAYGFTTLKQITHLKTDALLKKNVVEILKSMQHEGLIQQIILDGMPPIFVENNFVEKVLETSNSTLQILSPFDNSIIHRERIKQFFNFDFKLECYTPPHKRQYGYFCLPILCGSIFIGRVDCKAHRQEKRFELIHLHIENSHIDIEFWLKPFTDSISRFAHFNACNTITVSNVSPLKVSHIFRQAFC